MKKKIITVVMLMAILSSMFMNNVSVKAFELREGDSIEDDEDYADMDFDETDFDDDDDSEEVNEEDLDYDEAIELLEENDIDAEFKVVSTWQNHCNVEVTIKNTLDERIEDWEVKFELTAEVENIWNAKVTKKENSTFTIKNANWNQDIEVDHTVSFGMTLRYDSDTIEFPDKVFLTKECAEVVEDYDVTYEEYSRWDGNKVNGAITIKNLTGREIDDWKLELETNIKIDQIWNAVVEESDDNYLYLNNANYNPEFDSVLMKKVP